MRKALYTLTAGALALQMILSPACIYAGVSDGAAGQNAFTKSAKTAAENEAGGENAEAANAAEGSDAAAADSDAAAEAAAADSEAAAEAAAADTEADATSTDDETTKAEEAVPDFNLGDAAETADYLINNDQSGIIKREIVSESTEEFPERFDLRDKGVVTPVKFQNPWGTCWGFSAIAAAETSILSSLGKTYEETGLDLSEHQLTYFVNTYLKDGSSQDGEGVHMFEEYEGTHEMNTGNEMFAATSVFSTGIGVVDEDVIPYRGKNSLTDSFLILNFDYSDRDDWTLPEEYKFLQSYELINSDMLPSPAVYEEIKSDSKAYDEDADKDEEVTRKYIGYDQSATDKMKKALMEGKAISVAYAADQYDPSQLGSDTPPLYLNVEDNKWTQYTYDDAEMTHAVTIVGWDDTIKKEDFLDHSEEEWNDTGDPYQPEGDGAWIIKNSWGAATEEFPNSYSWGIKNEAGQETGYFYLSYYDKSISIPETFDFDTTDYDRAGYIIDQYNYLPAYETSGWLNSREMAMSNIFVAEYDEVLRALSCQTDKENTEVSFEVYLLDDESTTPDDGELVATEEATFAYSGYHRVNVSEPVHIKKGQRYSVVVTQNIEYDDELYYAISTSKGDNREAVEEYNRQVAYDNRGLAKSEYEDQLQTWYMVGIVNPGESYLYVGENRNWTDFADVVTALQDSDKYHGETFDNFPIKAYLDYENEADMVDTEELPDLGYSKPAGAINWRNAAIILAAFIVLIALMVLAVLRCIKRHKMKKKFKAQAKEIAALKADNEQLKAQTERLKTETEQSKAETEAVKADLEQLKSAAERLKTAAERLRAETELTNQEKQDNDV